jgi:septum formation inhibitor-activating ATPase MinD
MKEAEMGYEGPGKAETRELMERRYIIGNSPKGIDDALRAAVHHADMPSGTTFIVTQIEVESVDDPNVGGYRVVITPGG